MIALRIFALYLCSVLLFVTVFSLNVASAEAASIASRLSGRILLQVEDKGEAWYVHPQDLKRRYLGRPADAFVIMRELGLGISNTDLKALFGSQPNEEDTYASGDRTLALRLAGRILLQVEKNGEAYYLNPHNLRAYYLGRPADAFSVMREQGLGVSNSDINKIEATGRLPQDTQSSKKEPTNTDSLNEVIETQPRTTPPSQTSSCESNEQPSFTNDFTNTQNLLQITPPGTIMPDGDIKTHSWVWTDGNNVPLYAPTDMTLATGGYYTEGGVNQYIIFFDVSCEVEIKFDHIHTPIETIRNALPKEPKLNDTRTTKASERIKFKAGDLIGHTRGNDPSRNWDFGVYNKTITNYLTDDERFAGTYTYENAVCPFDYYTSSKRNAYRNLYADNAPTTFCL